MILTVMAAVPFLGALAVTLMPRGQSSATAVKVVAVAASVLTLVLSLAMMADYDVGRGGYQLTEQHVWIKQFGVHYALGVNGIGVTLILLTTVLTPIVLLAAWDDRLPSSRSVNSYLAWMLVLEGLAIGVFSATDAFLFYVLFEATLVPIYFLIGSYGGPQRTYAAVKFLIYNLVGGLLMLASIVGLYVVTARQGEATYLIGDLSNLDVSTTTERLDRK